RLLPGFREGLRHLGERHAGGPDQHHREECCAHGPHYRTLTGHQPMNPLLEHCTAHAAAIRSDVERLVRLESPSRDKTAVDRCGAAVVDLLRDAGASITMYPQADRGDHVRAEFDGGPSRVLILGHFDTVWDIGTLDRMPLREEEGRLHGP